MNTEHDDASASADSYDDITDAEVCAEVDAFWLRYYGGVLPTATQFMADLRLARAEHRQNSAANQGTWQALVVQRLPCCWSAANGRHRHRRSTPKM